MRTQHKRLASVFIISVFICALFVLPSVSLAATGEDIINTSYKDAIYTIYKTLLTVSRILAAISVAWAAIRMATAGGDERSWSRSIEELRKQLIYSVLALAALVLLPSVIKWAMSLVSSYAWNPWVGNSATYIPPADAVIE